MYGTKNICLANFEKNKSITQSYDFQKELGLLKC